VRAAAYSTPALSLAPPLPLPCHSTSSLQHARERERERWCEGRIVLQHAKLDVHVISLSQDVSAGLVSSMSGEHLARIEEERAVHGGSCELRRSLPPHPNTNPCHTSTQSARARALSLSLSLSGTPVSGSIHISWSLRREEREKREWKKARERERDGHRERDGSSIRPEKIVCSM